ncbi:hypothetical protein CFC21_009229 [Triticum aestivum]|uniref:DUF1645 domain-containing protein n=2 Tax=Triticum aestivum TaxID=4565 RepID=A0A9R1DHU7_WHEAT|nr:uncharacterized protein LOC123099992 [Triticum aestivum]KAF6992213.1 hypothetical protein CFC21_009228 [Triticum aestivum]KAF6992214.1 hypothetical protein CFC21_009229 [Triticum aestivum]
MEERIITPRRREPRDQNQTADAAPAVSCSSGEDSTSTDGDSEPGFEFEFPSLLGRGQGSPAPADDLFADGRIRPAAFYPVFARRPSARASSAGDVDGLGLVPAAAPERRTRGQLGRLFLEESRAWNSSSSSSSTGSTASTSSLSSAATADDGDGYGDGGLAGAAPESYCVWAPGGGGKSSESPRPPRGGKSGSTGSSVARWRRISDLVVGRSQSDGKEKFLFLPVNPPTPPPKQQEPKRKPRPNPATGGTKKKGSEIGTVAAAHRMAYVAKAGVGVAANGATPRRTFLPYREELVGFFANVNGISRSHAHPY